MRELPVPSFSAAAEAELSIAARRESADSYHRASQRPDPLKGRFNSTGKGTVEGKKVRLGLFF